MLPWLPSVNNLTAVNHVTVNEIWKLDMVLNTNDRYGIITEEC